MADRDAIGRDQRQPVPAFKPVRFDPSPAQRLRARENITPEFRSAGAHSYLGNAGHGADVRSPDRSGTVQDGMHP
nr:hypothetical protein [Arthrobacter sp. ISL-85]